MWPSASGGSKSPEESAARAMDEAEKMRPHPSRLRRVRKPLDNATPRLVIDDARDSAGI